MSSISVKIASNQGNFTANVDSMMLFDLFTAPQTTAHFIIRNGVARATCNNSEIILSSLSIKYIEFNTPYGERHVITTDREQTDLEHKIKMLSRTNASLCKTISKLRNRPNSAKGNVGYGNELPNANWTRSTLARYGIGEM